jgi:GNAT superfamily N-acetyltransferase
MHTWTRSPFEISTDRARLDVTLIHEFLAHTYWSPGIPREILERGIANSLNFGAYAEGAQVGFARVVTDRATFAYLCDVFVVDAWRNRGISKFMMECIKAHPALQNLRRWMLATADAHGLYRQFGFRALGKPERMMEIAVPDIYQRLGNADPRSEQ